MQLLICGRRDAILSAFSTRRKKASAPSDCSAITCVTISLSYVSSCAPDWKIRGRGPSDWSLSLTFSYSTPAWSSCAGRAHVRCSHLCRRLLIRPPTPLTGRCTRRVFPWRPGPHRRKQHLPTVDLITAREGETCAYGLKKGKGIVTTNIGHAENTHLNTLPELSRRFSDRFYLQKHGYAISTPRRKKQIFSNQRTQNKTHWYTLSWGNILWISLECF